MLKSHFMVEDNYLNLPGNLLMRFHADELDLLQFGVIGLHIHGILNQVAISIIQAKDEIAPGPTSSIKFIPQTLQRQDALIKARVIGFRQGSFEMEVQALVASVFSQPGAASILNNLLSSAIWAIGSYAMRMPRIRVIWKEKEREDDVYDILVRPEAGRRRLRPKIEKFIDALAESSNGGRLRLKTKDIDLEIEFNPDAKGSERGDLPSA